MGPEKVEITQEHILEIYKAVGLCGSQCKLAWNLGISQSSVSLWFRGIQIIPLKHAEILSKKFPEDLTVLSLRPDIEKYRKYFE